MTVKHLFPAVEPSLNLDFANSKKLDPRITFTRSSTGTYVDSNGLIKTAAANEARFDHDPESGSSLGLLIEESRTNLVTYSEQLNDASWTKVGTVTADSTVFVDGNATAELLTATSTEAEIKQYFNFGTVNTYHTFSVYVKKNTSRYCYLYVKGHPYAYFLAVFDLDTGICTQQDTKNSNYYPLSTNYALESVKLGNGYYRLSIANSTPTYAAETFGVGIAPQGTGNVLQTGSTPITGLTAGDSIYLGGAQLEAGSFPTSYIPTSGSTVTRSADVASMTGTNFSSWYNQSEGTIYANATRFSDNIYNQVVFSAHGVGTEEVRLQWYSLTPGFYVDAGPSSAGTRFTSSGLSADVPKWACSYKSLDFALAGNNQLLTNTTGGLATTPTFTTANIGHYNNGQRMVGHISRLTYYPYRLTDAQLEALTL